jgi:glyceraldehyde 3-phosphate dehydrogenase
LGVNEDKIDPNETVYSNASCTTNCLAPMVKIMLDNFGINRHHDDDPCIYGRSESPGCSTQGFKKSQVSRSQYCTHQYRAASALKLVIPEIGNKLSSASYRVPVITGSLVDLNLILEKSVTIEQINNAFLDASKNKMKESSSIALIHWYLRILSVTLIPAYTIHC